MKDVLHAPEQVGPYRVDHRLGQGGMGEVWAGFDLRLDRPVALKRIHSSTEDSEAARQRLRKEAKTLARLRHPAVVQVYDWIESDDGGWIVMELIHGISLRHLLRQGPMEPGRAIRLALDMLSGLAAAHACGVIHRDLKAENVMVAADSSPNKGEQAKILDFDIAKRFDPRTGDSVSVDELRMGTLTAMSPEQVRGHRLDPQSDLFSLGSLLYEMLTGVAPFRDTAPVDILQRICTWEPPEAHLENPRITPALSAFLQHLLAKDPRLRPPGAKGAFTALEAILTGLNPADDTWVQSVNAMETLGPTQFPRTAKPPKPKPRKGLLWIVGLSLVAVLVIAFGWWQQKPPTLYVAVPTTFTAVTGDPAPKQDLSLAASAVRTAILRGLLGFRQIIALEPSAEEHMEDLLALARAMAADEFLTSRLECGAYNCRLTLQRIRTADSRLLWTQGFPVESKHLLEISQAVLDRLRSAYPDQRLRPGVPELAVRAEDYEAFLVLKKRYEQRQAGFALDDLLTGFERLTRSSPRFLELSFFEAHVLVQSFQETRNTADLERAELAIERTAALAPEDPRVLFEKAHMARIAGKIDESESYLTALLRLEPGNVRARYQQARILERKGQTEEALDLMEEVLDRLPAAAYHFDFGGMLSRAGKIDEARRALEKGLTLVPGHYNGLSRLAQLELMSGSPARAAELYSQLVRRSPESTELANLGTAYLLTGDYRAAAENFRAALARAPHSSGMLLNLADAEFLSGRTDEAAQWYVQVLAAIDEDPEPEKWLTVRAQALAHLKRIPESIAAIQEALRLAPEEPMTAYEASLVFALVGDEASAVWNARRALDLGVDRRWFTFPWFDAIRSQLEASSREVDTPSPR